jgi:acyl-[acyl-carrier-protein]-phospholipid O-acyltransferase / long-chain-fatty-acid--[acyl-carrier-protein] ligase
MSQVFRSDSKSLYALNATQFLGALNDNVFKLLIIFLIIRIQGPSSAPSILATAGAVFVVPFLLFSSAAGVLADRISKRTILVAMKIAEVVIMSLSVLAIYYQSKWACLFFLFCLGVQAAFFGPSKYGIITEIVPPEKVSKANGLLGSFTYLAIIIGTFLAAFLADITHKNFVLSSLACVVIALVGMGTSFPIIKTPAKGSTRKINPLFIYEIYQTLRLASRRRFLLMTIIGSGYFLFIGGFAQLNTIPYAIQSLGLTEIGGGYLFLSTAIGIAIGSLLAGFLSKDPNQPAISCIASFAISFLLIMLYIVRDSLPLAIFTLILLGVFGGLFLIPLDSFIQVKSPGPRRGQIISAANFLSFFGVLLASAFLEIASDILGFSSASGFAILGISTFFFSILLTARLAPLFFPYLGQTILRPLLHLRTEKPPQASLLILDKRRWKILFLLYYLIPHLTVFTLGKKGRNFPYFNGLIPSLHLVQRGKNVEESIQNLLLRTKKEKKKYAVICFFIDKKTAAAIRETPFSPTYFVKTEKIPVIKYLFGHIRIKQRQLHIRFLEKLDLLPNDKSIR